MVNYEARSLLRVITATVSTTFNIQTLVIPHEALKAGIRRGYPSRHLS